MSSSASQQQILRLALAQVHPSEGDIEDAFAKLRSYARRASQAGADVVVFPEYFLTGATHEAWENVRAAANEEKLAGQNDEAEERSWLEHVQSIAREEDIDIVAGTVVEPGEHDANEQRHIPHRTDPSPIADPTKRPLYNRAYYLSRDGQDPSGTYTKKNLWHPERATLSAGDAHSVTFNISTKRGLKLRAALLICWDLAFPEMFRALFTRSPSSSAGKEELEGPDVVFVPTCWYATDAGARGLAWNTQSEAALLDAVCVSRAIETECVLAMCNVAGPTSQSSPSDPMGVGRSCVTAPFLGCVKRLEHCEEELLLADVDARVLKDARETYRIRHDLVEIVS